MNIEQAEAYRRDFAELQKKAEHNFQVILEQLPAQLQKALALEFVNAVAASNGLAITSLYVKSFGKPSEEFVKELSGTVASFRTSVDG